VQSGLQTTEHAVDLLTRLVGGMANDKAVGSIYWKHGKDLLATIRRGVDVAILEVLDDLTGVLLRIVGGVGVGDIGLGIVYQSACIGCVLVIDVPCGHR